MKAILEPSRSVPVLAEADVCVVGGSCTGVFAAVRAARLGARVVLVEQLNCFGGTATASMVNIWHSLHDTEGYGLHQKCLHSGEQRHVHH